jgi:hypothetical protein
MVLSRVALSRLALLLFAAGCGCSRLEAAAPAKAEETADYLRLERDAKGRPLALETAIVRFTKDGKDEGPIVDLIGAVHIGDKQYFDDLNKEFEKYDVVLYELVAPEGTRVAKGGGGRSSHPIAALQNGMKSVLELEHQLEHVDYQKDNLVHADMSPDDFSRSMKDKGESFLTMYFRLMGAGLAMQGATDPATSSDAAILMALFDKNRALSLKRLMAEQFEKMEIAMSALDGPEGSTLLAERNKVALKGLKKQLDAGKQKIAIFYGAGHLPDMAQRLEADFHLEPASTRWMRAWDLRTPKTAK